ncbi:hypothetical protein SRHO_G00178130 [Serrasalmus rhombeus]
MFHVFSKEFSATGSTSGTETDVEKQRSWFGSSVIITVCICVALLLIGGSALIVYKLRNHMTQVSASTGQRTDKNEDDDDYENVPHGKRYDISMIPVHRSLNPHRSDLLYENPDPNTNQSDSDYENIAENTNQSDFIYENANINSSR